MSGRAAAVLLLGATGYTGRLTAAVLAAGTRPFILAGRDQGRLEQLRADLGLGNAVELRVADPLRPATLAALFPGVGVILNCAGPFTTLGEPVVRAAVAAGVHYLDISGEQPYLARIIARYDAAAALRDCAVVPACGVEYALTNWAAAHAAAGLAPLDRVWTATAATGVVFSRGTQLSALAALAAPGRGRHDGRTVVQLAGSATRRVTFPPPFGPRRALWVPFGELVTLPRHLPVRDIDSYLALPPALILAAQLTWPLLPAVSAVLGPLGAALLRGPHAATPEVSQWAVIAEAAGPTGTHRVTLNGSAVYLLTARILCWCAEALLAADFTGRGVLGPAQAFDPAAGLTFLQSCGVSCHFDPSTIDKP